MVSLVEPLVKREAFGKGLPPNPPSEKARTDEILRADPARLAPPYSTMTDFTKLIARLQKHYGAPELPPARGAFELVLWENACYLLPDHRRAAVFEGLRGQVGLAPDAILQAPREVLLPLATMGGMRPETRVFRWQEIARITATQFQGNLEQILEWPRAGHEGAEIVPQYRRPWGGEDSSFLRRRGGTAARIERSARADADRVRTRAPEELRRHVPLRAGSYRAGTAHRRPAAGPRPSAAARAREDDLPRQPTTVPRMPRRGRLRFQESGCFQRLSKYSWNRGLNPPIRRESPELRKNQLAGGSACPKVGQTLSCVNAQELDGSAPAASSSRSQSARSVARPVVRLFAIRSPRLMNIV